MYGGDIHGQFPLRRINTFIMHVEIIRLREDAQRNKTSIIKMLLRPKLANMNRAKLKENLINAVKGNTTIYTIYYYTMSMVIRIIKAIVKPDDKLALFVSYGGRYFNDSPKSLYEAMQIDSRFEGYRLVWAFRNPSQHHEVRDKVKIDSLSYFITALKARLWITNVHIERGLDFKGKNTYYFNTTHTLLCQGIKRRYAHTERRYAHTAAVER